VNLTPKKDNIRVNHQFSEFVELVKSNPAFRRLWIAHIISMLGDWFSYIAVSLIAIERGEGAFAIALVLVAHTLPTALMAPISGPLADRYDKRVLLIFSYSGAAILTFLMWGVSGSDVWLIQVVLFFRVSISGIGMTARSSSIPQLVGHEHLQAANALLGLTWSVAFTSGLALGGIIASVISPAGAILIDGLTFIAATLVYSGLPSLPPSPSGNRTSRPRLRDMIEAWQFVRTRPRILATVFAKSPAMMANSGGWLVLNMIAAQRLQPMDAGIALGLMHAIRAIGSGVGPLLPDHLFPRHPMSGAIAAFVGVVMFGAFESPWVFFVGLFIWGVGGGHTWVMTTAEIQRVTPNRVLGRVTALDFLIMSSSQVIVVLLAAVIIDMSGHPKNGIWLAVSLGLGVWLLIAHLYKRSPSIATANDTQADDRQHPDNV
jgi:MFS family permease